MTRSFAIALLLLSTGASAEDYQARITSTQANAQAAIHAAAVHLCRQAMVESPLAHQYGSEADCVADAVASARVVGTTSLAASETTSD